MPWRLSTPLSSSARCKEVSVLQSASKTDLCHSLDHSGDFFEREDIGCYSFFTLLKTCPCCSPAKERIGYLEATGCLLMLPRWLLAVPWVIFWLVWALCWLRTVLACMVLVAGRVSAVLKGQLLKSVVNWARCCFKISVTIQGDICDSPFIWAHQFHIFSISPMTMLMFFLEFSEHDFTPGIAWEFSAEGLSFTGRPKYEWPCELLPLCAASPDLQLCSQLDRLQQSCGVPFV